MKTNRYGRWLCALACAGLLVAPEIRAADEPAGIVGKNEWLFYRYELTDSNDAASIDVTLDLIQRLNKVLSANGTTMVVAMVPIKMRIYAEHLPDSVQLNSFMAGNYDRMRRALESAQVRTVDLNGAFMGSALRSSDTPLFFRLDTHWTPTGAMLAAETVKAGISGVPALQQALAATPEEGFKLVVNNRKRPSASRDLVGQLPANTLTFAPEQVTRFSVSRMQAVKEDLLGNAPIPGIALVGSSYSRDWTGFADALRHALQRDILDISVSADQGSWVGMESFLRDDAFQTKAPKILIWEMPERDLRAPPDYKFREARYVSNNIEWLLRVSALAQAGCKPSNAVGRMTGAGLAANPARVKGNDLAGGPTNDNDFVEIGFDKPVERLDYVMARATASGSKVISIEASGPGVAARRFSVAVPGDDAAHVLKTPLPSSGTGFTKVRIYPGRSTNFALQAIQVCRQPEDLLK